MIDLLYREDDKMNIYGLSDLRSEKGFIAAEVRNNKLILRYAASKDDTKRYKYFVNVHQDRFLDFINSYCDRKGLRGLQFFNDRGVYTEMYNGDAALVERAIHFAKEYTRMKVLIGNWRMNFYMLDRPEHYGE